MKDEEMQRQMQNVLAIKEKHRTYKALLSCLNCGKGWGAEIPKGTSVRTQNPECPNCGCRLRDIAEEFERK